MTNDFDQLLRDTLHGRAASVTDAPVASPSPPRRAERSRWVLIAATVAAVLVVGGGVAVWGLGQERSTQQSGGGYGRTCRTKLPGAWHDAFAASPVRFEGHAASVEAVTSFGIVVSWTTGDHRLVPHVGIRATDGGARTVFVGSPGDSVSTSVGGADLVLSIRPTKDNDPDTPVDDIVAVDLRTFGLRHLLPVTAMPRGTVVADKTAEVLDGVVYWAAVPAGSVGQASTGTVLAYVLATGRARVAGHAPLLLSADPRGVTWAGGRASAHGVPASVPHARDDGYDPVVFDGKNFAWLRTADPHTIGWADSLGDGRRWSVETVAESGIRSDPIAVSGPFVLLEPMGYGNPHVYVLDTRTGAVADSGILTFGGTAYGSRVAIITRWSVDAPFETVVFDTAHLPELRCR